ncbi:hypothetical protein NYE24_06855 [Paenibacillus sp. FSL H7-0350]|uniref:hypothetical protein n=1 Tax=unclassified Paenibacillus TaxID=185978 RepID=UPI0003E1C886|nr:hypothetical protein [Paenibacillus sp. FSL R7-269]ETT33958.1 hypothetical protein C162_30465 [Paenibacillus sp. FSL R7-269]
MKKLLFIISVCFLLLGCSNTKATSNNNLSNSDPVTWLTIDGNKYFYTTTYDQMDETTLVDTGNVTDTEDGIQLGLKIYKSNVFEDRYFIKSQDYENVWREYKLRD